MNAIQRYLILAFAAFLGAELAACDKDEENDSDTGFNMNWSDGRGELPAPDVVGEEAAVQADEKACEATCEGKQCGTDGCGGFCGVCGITQKCDPETFTCIESYVCTPECDGKLCGPDGCGGQCGTCPCDGCEAEAIYCGETAKCGSTPVTCSDLDTCMKSCPAGNESCFNGCLNTAPLDARLLYQDLSGCLEESGYFACSAGDEPCKNVAMGKCSAEYYDCFAGDWDCTEMYLCLAVTCSSPQAGAGCQDYCYDQGSKETMEKWDLFAACLEEAGRGDCQEGDAACIDKAWDACREPFAQCVHGSDTCAKIKACTDACDPTEPLCALECLIAGTMKAQAGYQAVLDCVVKECGQAPTAACQGEALAGPCKADYEKCI
jgi:hypothetical protein